MSLKSFIVPIEIRSYKSHINGIIKIREFFGKKCIVVDEAEQTGGTITGMWEKTMSVVSSQLSVVSKCLILGLGGGDVIRMLIKYYSQIKFTCIELDPVMREIYNKYFQNPLKSSKISVKIIIADAFQWIQRNLDKKYDLILVDLYIGKYNPKEGKKKEFLLTLKKLLNVQGIIIYNRHYRESNDSDYQIFLKLCRQVFPDVLEIVKYPYCRILLLSTDHRLLTTDN